jgi:hypothetical protein
MRYWHHKGRTEREKLLLGWLQGQIIERGMESTTAADGAEMLAWELGDEGDPLPDLLLDLGALLGVDVVAEWREGHG